MGKNIPTTLVQPELNEVQLGQAVESTDWVTLNQALHHRFVREGCRLDFLVLDDDHNPWQTASTSLVSANSGTGDLDLDDSGGLWQFQRKIYAADTVAAAGYEVTLQVYAQNLSVRLQMVRADSAATLPVDTGTNFSYTLDVATATGDAEWVDGSLEFTEAQASILGSTANELAYFWCFLQAKVPSTGTGFLWQAEAFESRVGTNELPQG